MKLNIVTGTPAKGKLLISDPFLQDPGFKRTVVLITEHNEEGTVGFVLNRPVNALMNEALVDFQDFNVPLYMGGPVQPDTLHYIHTVGNLLPGSIKIADNLWWGGSFETLKVLAESKQLDLTKFKFFIGYSGWSPGQLNEELEEKSWVVTDATMQDIYTEKPDLLWRTVLENMGKDYAVLANFPEDPALN